MLKKRRFSRKKDQRRALLRSLTRELVLRGKIKTTLARAKEVSIFTEKEINKAKAGGLQSRRMLAGNFSSKVAKKIINEIAPRYKERKGGYTRIVRLSPRPSDGAKMAIIELV